MKDTKTNTYIKSFYCILLGLTLFLGCNTTPTSEKQEPTPKTVADTTMPVDTAVKKATKPITDTTMPVDTAVKKATKPITDTTVKKATKTTPAVSTIRDTAMVLYYFPQTYGRYSTLIVTNKQGQRSSYAPGEIPVQRGDEIIYETTKINETKYFKLIQNITMNKLEQEYIKKR